jgi:hypothetical protein
MWKLQTDEKGKRTYANEYGSTCIQTLCYQDKDKNNWWAFDDLFTLPYTRNFAATKVTSLYALGLSKDDLTVFVDRMKGLLKSDDREKYEKIYAQVLDFEQKADSATNAIKQITALTCVYFTINDEPIDSFDGPTQMKKMALMEADQDMHTFFLNRQMQATEDYSMRLQQLSQIVSNPLTESD